MKKIFLAMILFVSTMSHSQNYVKASDTLVQSIVVPDEVIHPDYSIVENGKSYQGDTILVRSLNDLKFDGFKSQKIVTETKFFYSQKEKKNVTTEVTRPLSEMTVSWVLIILVFLYYLVSGYWILKVKDDAFVAALAAFVAAVAAVAAFVALAADFKTFKILFFLFSLVATGIVSYYYATPLFITCCAAGLGIALLIRSRQVSSAQPQTF